MWHKGDDNLKKATFRSQFILVILYVSNLRHKFSLCGVTSSYF